MVWAVLGGCAILVVGLRGASGGYLGNHLEHFGNGTELAGPVYVFGASPGAEEVVEYQDPKTAFEGIYTKCVFRLDYPCVQRKAVMFIDRLGRAPEYQLLPGVRIVRTATEPKEPLDEVALAQADSGSLAELIDDEIDQFYDEHVYRLELPTWMKDTWLQSSGRSYKSHLDLFFGDYVDEGRGLNNDTLANPVQVVAEGRHSNATGNREGRLFCKSGGKKKKGGKKGGKMIKKCMMMMGMMIAGKTALLMPMGMMMVKTMAMKALLLSKIALILALVMILKKMMGGGKGMKGMMMMMGHGGGGGWQDAGGGGGGYPSGAPAGGGWDEAGAAMGGGGGGGGWQGGGGGGGGGGGWERNYLAHNMAYRGYPQPIQPIQPMGDSDDR